MGSEVEKQWYFHTGNPQESSTLLADTWNKVDLSRVDPVHVAGCCPLPAYAYLSQLSVTVVGNKGHSSFEQTQRVGLGRDCGWRPFAFFKLQSSPSSHGSLVHR